MSRLANADPARDLLLLYGVLLAAPLIIFAVVAVGAACNSLWDYISHLMRNILRVHSSASIGSETANQDSQ